MTGPGDVRVAPARLSDSASASKAVADTVRGADVAGPVRAAGPALPGSGYGAAAQDLAVRWGALVTALADAVAQHSTALSDTVDAYRQTDHRAAIDMQPSAPTATSSATAGPGAITRALG